jgi:hypothetical protein
MPLNDSREEKMQYYNDLFKAEKMLQAGHLVFKLVTAAAAARSGFPLALLVATLGKPDPEKELVLEPRLLVAGCKPFTVE